MINKITLLFIILTIVTSISAENNSPIYLANTTNKTASITFYNGYESFKCPGNQCGYSVPNGAWGIKTGNTIPVDNESYGYGFIVNWNGHKIFDSGGSLPYEDKSVYGSDSILIKLKAGTSSPSVCINCF